MRMMILSTAAPANVSAVIFSHDYACSRHADSYMTKSGVATRTSVLLVHDYLRSHVRRAKALHQHKQGAINNVKESRVRVCLPAHRCSRTATFPRLFEFGAGLPAAVHPQLGIRSCTGVDTASS